MQWILFDIGGVLEVVDDDQWQTRWMERWLFKAGLTHEQYQARAAAVDLPNIALHSGVEAEYWRLFGATLGLNSAEIAQMRTEMWDAYCGTGNTELIEYAKGLKGRAGLAILSNSADGAREEEERRYGFSQLFDPICYSHELGAAKPDQAAYLKTLGAMNAQPHEVFFIDDREEAVQAAAALGIQSVRHESNQTTIAAVESFLTSTRSSAAEHR